MSNSDIKLKILVVSQYFWPEAFIINDLVRTLVLQGHEVVVLTGKPNYPDGQVFEGYRADGFDEDTYADKIKVYRVPLRPRGKGGAKNLLLNYLSFVVSGIWFSGQLKKCGSFDVILSYAPSPITSVIPAIFLKWKFKAHLAVWIQDLWPESLKATGFIRSPWILGLAGLLVRAIYFFSNTLLIQSRSFRGPVSKYAKEDKIAYYPNFYTDLRCEPVAEPELPADLVALLKNEFCLVFAGNIGTAQSVETIVEAAELIRHLESCKLVIVGSGSMLPWLQEQKVTRGLDNLVLTGRFPPSKMPSIFSLAKGLLLTLKHEEIFAYTVPSKVQAYLSAGRPIVAAIDGEGGDVIKEAGAGLVCPAEDAAGLASCIERLYRLAPMERDAFGAAGRAYFLENFELVKQCCHLVSLLESRMDIRGN